jgi:hypothetical protein
VSGDWESLHWLEEPPISLDREQEETLARIADELDPGEPLTGLPLPVDVVLRWLVANRPVLLHGSNDVGIDRFEPRPQMDFEGRPTEAVFGTSDGIWPMFFAVVDRERNAALRNGCLRSGGRSKYFFAVDPGDEDAPRWRAGAVYVLPRAPFRAGFGLEWLAEEAVEPLARVVVEPKDFPFLDQVLTFHAGEPEDRFAARIEGARAEA